MQLANPIAAPANSNIHRRSFRYDIEGLRAVAVLAVVAFHFGVPLIPGGFVGVDVFFVISGYLITGLLLAELETTGHVDLLRFYGRRARRLLPAALLMTLVTLACGALLLTPSEQLQAAKAAVCSSLYSSNFWFLRQTFDYFAPESGFNPFLHTWSLAVEEQFYLVWPALLLLSGRRKVHPLLLTSTIAAVTVASFALSLRQTDVRQPWAFYASPARAWEFGLGGLASLAPVSRWAERSRLAPKLGWVALAAMFASFIVIGEGSRFPGWVALLPVTATALVLVSGANRGGQGPARLLRTAPFQWFGQRSYSIYLWHWPIIVLAANIVSPIPVFSYLVCGALTIVLAALSFQLVESPIRRNSWLTMRAVRSVSFGSMLTLAGASAAVAAALFARQFNSQPTQRNILEVTGEASVSRKLGCLLGFTETRRAPCNIGVVSASKTVVLFGDSHADQWSTPLANIAKTEGWRVLTYLKSSCSVADIPVYNLRLHRYSPECMAWRSESIASIVALRPDLIIVGEFSRGYVHGPITGLGKHAVDATTWSDGLRKSLIKLRGAGSAVVVLRDTPSPGRDIRRCLERAAWKRASFAGCDTPRSAGLDAALAKAEEAAAASVPEVRFVDLTPQLCSNATCPAVVNGMIAYRDNNHMSTRFAETLAEPLRAMLASVMR